MTLAQNTGQLLGVIILVCRVFWGLMKDNLGQKPKRRLPALRALEIINSLPRS